ncbi:MAG: putative ABC transporter permease, partial [Clostridia bacterium]|nr:putative ABC transporter permease [Clostridia bacterium]
IIMKKEKSFAEGLNLYKLFWIFYIGCLAGVIIEIIWCLVKNGYFEYRTAMILEPLNPVYGFGALLLTLCFSKVKKLSDILIFVYSFIIGGLFEVACSLFQEFTFGTVSWHYTENYLPILGNRTSLIYCLFWGILGLLWVKFIYPFLTKTIEKLPNKFGKILTYILVVFVSFDIIFSSGAVLRQRERRNGIPADSAIDRFYDSHFDDETLKFFYNNIIVKD